MFSDNYHQLNLFQQHDKTDCGPVSDLLTTLGYILLQKQPQWTQSCYVWNMDIVHHKGIKSVV